VIDAQAGHEKTITSLLPALAGSNLIYGMGMLELGVTFSYGQLLIDNEIASMVKRVVRGSPVDNDTIGTEVIHKIGSGKNFLKEKHTLKYMPSEQSKVKLFDRRTRGAWTKKGGTDVATRAEAMAADLLKTHEAMPLDPAVHEAMKKIIVSAEE